MSCCGGCGGQTAEKETINSYLGKDHERLDNLLQNFASLKKDNKRAGIIFQTFSSGLKRHINWEELLLFPLFEDHTGSVNSGPTAVMRSEHAEIKVLINEIEKNIGLHLDSTAATQKLITLLADHNFKEEKILYPSMDDFFSDEETNNAIRKMISECE